MSCEGKRSVYDSALGDLEILWQELQIATPSRKPAIVKEIRAQNIVVQQARAAYEACVRAARGQVSVATADLVIRLRAQAALLDFNEKTNKRFEFSGSPDLRDVRVEEIIIQRTLTMLVDGIHGTFDPSTGEMSLHATVTASFLAESMEQEVALITGSTASPRGKIAGTGAPLDPSTRNFVLVGGGSINTHGFDTDFFITMEGTFLSAP